MFLHEVFTFTETGDVCSQPSLTGKVERKVVVTETLTYIHVYTVGHTNMYIQWDLWSITSQLYE